MKPTFTVSLTITRNLVLFTIFCVFLNNSFGQQVVQPFQCAGVRENDYIRNVSDCRGWIRCKANGQTPSGFCAEDKYFDEQSQRCISSNASCFSCPDSSAFTNVYVNNTCNRFIQCIKTKPTEKICEDDLQFNQVTRECDLEANVGCTKEFTCPDVPAGDFYAVHDPANCSIGLSCFGDRVAVPKDCSPLHFIIETGNCGYPANSGCVESTTTTATT